MQSRGEFNGVNFRSSAVFFTSIFICSLLGWFLLTPVLHAKAIDMNMTFFYLTHAFVAGGDSVHSSQTRATIVVAAPAVPGNLKAVAMSKSQIKLSWQDNSTNEDSFKIERRIGTAGTYKEITRLKANQTSYDDKNLLVNTLYFYRVRASNVGGLSDPSKEDSAKTFMNGPTNLAVTAVSSNQIDLTWRDNTMNETSFIIERRLGTQPESAYAPIGTAPQNATSFSNTGLPANTQYFYRVYAINNAINSTHRSDYSNATNKTTFMNGPTNLVATVVGSNQIKLTWTDKTANETSFQIQRSTIAVDPFTQIGTAKQNTTSFSDTGLAANSRYIYRVRAVNASNVSGYSNESNVITWPDPLAPQKPSDLTATAISKDRIHLTWRGNSNNAVGFQIERKPSQGGASTFAEITTVAANETSYTNSSLQGNTEYCYRVRAFNARGHSSYSNEACATTFADPPGAPSNLTAIVASPSQINLGWTDNSTNETGFAIKRSTSAGGPFTQVGTVAANVKTFSNTSLTASTQYFYQVCATNANGSSAASNTANVSTLANDPNNIALNKPITASSTEAGSTPTRANDGNIISLWRSGPASAGDPIEWIRVDLGAGSTVARVVMIWNQSYHATQYEIQVSNDGTNWTIVQTNNASTNATQDISFTPVSARYVRAYLKMPNSGSYRMTEFKAYATGSISKQGEQAATENAMIPETISLEQNYPNPFSPPGRGTLGNPATIISFSLPAGAHISLKVVNVAGQEVATLMNGYRDRGIHRATFNAKKLPSGVYYAVLKAGEVARIIRMTLAK